MDCSDLLRLFGKVGKVALTGGVIIRSASTKTPQGLFQNKLFADKEVLLQLPCLSNIHRVFQIIGDKPHILIHRQSFLIVSYFFKNR